MRAGGASYEELHARGGGILSTVRATRAAGEDGLASALAEHVGWMLQAGTTTFEAKSGYGLDRETELAQLRAIVDAGGVATWLGAHAVPPEFADDGADAYVDFLARRGAAGRGAARGGGRRLPRAWSVRRRRRRAATSRAAATPASRSACTATSSRRSGAIPLAIELGARSVDHLEATGATGIAALAASDVAGVLLAGERALPRIGRCRRRARSSTRARRSRSRPTSTRAARSARACRSSARSPARSSAVAGGGACRRAP